MKTLTRLQRAQINYKRARTRNANQQARGLRDMSVRQTRRMASAVYAFQRAYFELRDAERASAREQA